MLLKRELPKKYVCILYMDCVCSNLLVVVLESFDIICSIINC